MDRSIRNKQIGQADWLVQRSVITRALIVLACVLIAAALLPGCASNNASGGTSGDSYEQAYAKGRYADAYDQASKIAGSQRGKNRDQAALIAGLSARSLDRNADADRWLRPLITNSDPTIQGRAAAAVGLLSSDANKHEEAARLLELASRRLKGDDAARASMYAGDSLRALNRTQESKAAWQRAKELVEKDASLRMIINDRLAGQGPPPLKPGPITGKPTPGAGDFTVQAGAYGSLRDAQRRANQLTNFGTTRVVERTDKSGNKLFAVRVGQYSTQQAARDVAKQIGTGAFSAKISDER